MVIERILVVDDEPLVRTFLFETLKRTYQEVSVAKDGKEALTMLKEKTFDLVITDLKMAGVTGFDVLKEVKTKSPETIVIMITAFGTVESAVEAMRLGAFNFLIKPFSPDTIEALIEKANEQCKLVHQHRILKEQAGHFGNRCFIAESPQMKKILEEIDLIARSSANVMITGESGTGKEEIARAIYTHSNRKEGPYIQVNVAAIPESLVESEFFGHEKGAFTGAHARRLGRFELASGGTLLLDEVTEVPLMLQAKLLRAIQEQEFERIGGVKPIKVDVRIISTSNRDITNALVEKKIREDLYYRLNVIPIHLPPLRERKEDILPLATHFMNQACQKNGRKKKTFSKEAVKALLDYFWPGNVRELANTIERAVVLDSGDEITKELLHLKISSDSEESTLPTGITLHELEKRMIIETLNAQKFNRTKTAQILGISVRTLRNKLHEYNVSEELLRD